MTPAPSYGAYAVCTPARQVAGYVHHDARPSNRYRAVPRTAPAQWGRRATSYPTHDAARAAVLAHHYSNNAPA